jgi:hypothetical protein
MIDRLDLRTRVLIATGGALLLMIAAISYAVATRDPERASRAARTLEELRRSHDRAR